MEDYKYKLSIIIPMYNAEKYIANCLDSILNSDLPKDEYEVVIINDGSTDNSPSIAQEYVKLNEHFTYLTQDNQGQSVARNYGIERSRGEYIWFVDADDRIDQKICPILHEIERLGKPEIFSFLLRYVSESGEFISTAFHFPGTYNKLISGRNAILSNFQPSSVCVYFIKRSFIISNELKFYPGIYHQDSEFSFKMMAKAQHVFFSKYIPYIYIKHPNSVVTSTSHEMVLKKKLDDIIIMNSFHELSLTFATSDSALSQKISTHINNMAFGSVYQMYTNREKWKASGINSQILINLKKYHYYPLKGPFDSWKKKLVSWWLNIESNLV